MSIRNYGAEDARPLLHPAEAVQEKGLVRGIGAVALAGVRLPLAIALGSETSQRTSEAFRNDGLGGAVLALFNAGPDAK